VKPLKAPHPIIWLILYLPFGALSGFVTVALTFVATKEGLSISEGAALTASQLLVSWLKWTWAPLVDVTLSPRKWYLIACSGTALGVATLSAMPLTVQGLPLLLTVIAITSLINSVVGMAIEAILSSTVEASEIGRASGWFQAGNLGGGGLGGGLGLYLMTHMPARWMGGSILGVLFLCCSFALYATPVISAHAGSIGAAVRAVQSDLVTMLKTRGGLTAALLCFLPVGTGAAQGLLGNEKIAALWGAGDDDVALVQGVYAGVVTAAGCFAGGALCKRIHPRVAYALIALLMAGVAIVMAFSPMTRTFFLVMSLAYSFVTGLAYAGFSALVLDGMGKGSGATKYNVFASLSNFPLWWLGILLGMVAQKANVRAMLLTDASFGIVGVAIFAFAYSRIQKAQFASESTRA
jgi:MFS transporter, PAT family, beta-lactamase induction signal transducer AmpG